MECSKGDVVFGPALPPCLKKSVSSEEEKEKEALILGPALPPDFKQPNERDATIIGPTLPPNLSSETETENNVGPDVAPHLKERINSTPDFQYKNDPEDDSGEIYGPLPLGAGLSKAHIELEERALQIKIDNLEPGGKEPTREEWMLELPEIRANSFGLSSRKFRTKEGADFSDRSSWTETPKEKLKKSKETNVDLKRKAEVQHIKEKDEQQEIISKRNKHDQKSLLEMHLEKSKKKNDEQKPTERKPFSRETDLQVNRFDDAQKKAVLKKAQLLDNRFSSGQSKFL